MKTMKRMLGSAALAAGLMTASAASASAGYALMFDNNTNVINTASMITTTAFTVECWVRPAEMDTAERIVLGQYSGTGRILCEIKDKKTRFFVGDGSPKNEATGSATLVPGVWYHLAYTRDNAGAIKTYVNGVLDAEAQVGTLALPATPIRVGSHASNLPAIIGNYSEARVWEHAKTVAEINDGMYTRAVGNEPGLLICLPMNDNAFTINQTIETIRNVTRSAPGIVPVFRDDLPFVTTTPSIVAACTNTGYALTFTPAASNTTTRLVPSSTTRITTAAFTIEGWLRPSGLGAERQIFTIDQPTSNRLKLRLNDSNGVLRVQHGSRVLDAASTVTTGEWFHYAVTRDDAGVVSLYLNGELSAARNINGGLPDGSDLIFGHGTPSNDYQSPSGDWCEQRVWSVALTREQIQSNLFTRLVGDEPGLLYYWSLDEGPGNMYCRTPTTDGSTLDLSGAYEWTAYTDLPVRPAAAVPGNVLAFTAGTDIVNTSARVTTDTFTIECWAKFDDVENGLGGEYHLFNQDLNAHADRLFLHIRGGKPVFQVGHATSAMASTLTITTNRWYHFAAVRDNQGNGRLYIDGRRWAATSALTSTGIPTAADITWGRLHRIADRSFLGQLSEARIWDVVRTQAEIVSSMRKRMEPGMPGLVYCWPMNQATGSAQERVAGANGTLAGPAWAVCEDTPFLVPASVLYPKRTLFLLK